MSKTLRAIVVDGDLAYICLSNGEKAIIDSSDVELVKGFNWTAVIAPRSVYAMRRGRLSEGGERICIPIQRQLLQVPDGMFVDHINGNGLDNRRENLRITTKSENNRNRRLNTNSTSGLKGVTFHKPSRKWRAQIMALGVKTHLGLFLLPEAAHHAYVVASKKFHKNYGCF